MTRLLSLPRPDLPDLTTRQVELLSIRHTLSRIAARLTQRPERIRQSKREIREVLEWLEEYEEGR
jgi:hypothetical protein